MAISNAALAQQVSDLVGKWTSHEVELASWASGTAIGGPYGDGRYPLTGPYGTVLYLACPAALAAQVSSTVSGGAAYAAAAELAKAAAEAAQAGAFDARDLALAYKASTEAARDAAQTAATAAANSEANALVHEQAAGTSAASSADSAATAAQAVTDASAARDTAATSAADAYGSASAAAASAATAQAAAATAQAAATGALHYKGSWDATTGFPAGPVLGDLWKVSVAGGDYSVGDQIIYNGSGWDKIDNTEAVTSVAGRVGPVVLGISDITMLQTTLDAKLDSAAFTWSGLYGKPTTFAPSAHAHSIADVSGLQGVLDTKVVSDDGRGYGISWTGAAAKIRVNTTTLDLWTSANFDPASKAPTDSPIFTTRMRSRVGDNNWALLAENFEGSTARGGIWCDSTGLGLVNSTSWSALWMWNDGSITYNGKTLLTTGNCARVFTQSTDPGTAAKDGDLWVW